MKDTQGPLQETRAALVRNCLDKILGCSLFVQAERQQRFLHYLVEQTLTGQGYRLKGYSIGAAVFDRNDDFDPRLDAIVRVEATRLRSKLREYYEDAGRLDEVRIELPKGCYELKFSFQIKACASAQAVLLPAPETTTSGTPTDLTPAISVPSDKPSLAVLPFANLSRDPDQDYFADGMTDDLITSLSKLSGLLVIGRQSVFLYKGSNKDAREIARELGVRYLLEGSVRRLEHRVRINAQLVEAAHGLQVWAERYDRDLEDIFALQDDVTRRIVEALEVHLSEAESKTLVRTEKVGVEAHDLLLCGLERYWEYTSQSVEAAQEFFVKALEIDPNYATAHAWLARAYLYRFATLLIDRPELFDRPELCELAFHHARKAVDLNPGLPLGHSILGWAHLWRGQAVEALGASRRAVQMDPNNPDAHLFLSIILGRNGRSEEAADCMQKATRLNPHPTTFYLFALGVCRFNQARYEEAAAAFKKGIDLAPGFTPHAEFLIATYGLLGRIEEATHYRDAILPRRPRYDARWGFLLSIGVSERFRAGLKRAGVLLPGSPGAQAVSESKGRSSPRKS
jgi:TolB-like protein